MIEARDRMILIDGQPKLVLAGEIHYFRLRRNEWQDRIDKLKSIGGNCVASYVPWLTHEQPDGSFDFDGRTREQTDLAGFVDLCHENGLWFLVRVGPFIMAEMKNEGLPYRLYTEHPEIVPVGWDGQPAPSRTVDYLAPAFLLETRRWYAALLPVVTPRLYGNGGPVIAVQLDNEVGMLSWVTNAPDLTEGVIGDFVRWLREAMPSPDLATRYPFDLDDPVRRLTAIRTPDDSYAPALSRDLGRFMRDRFARYIATLRRFAEDEGIAGVPFLVNIHGTGGGRAKEFPIGISQLIETYTQAPGYISGSDHYLGDLTRTNFVDVHLINAYMEATNRPEQPLTALEFEAGDGDYSGDGSSKTDPSAADFKLRMSLAQGNRLINYYLFSGGINERLDPPSGDGNDRISFTGERHGNAAPVGPEGQLNATFPRLRSATRTMMAVSDTLASMHEERDGIAIGFNPDEYLTENSYPRSEATRLIDDDLARNRFGGPNQSLARSMLLLGLRFSGVDVRNPIHPATVPTLAFGCSRYMDATTQQHLVDYVSAGGKLLLVGEVPRFDLIGAPATLLCDALGLTPTTDRRSEDFHYLSIEGTAWASDLPEYRVGQLQGFDATTPGCFLRAYGTGEGCGFERTLGAGRATVVTTDLPGDLAMIRTVLAHLDIHPVLRHDAEHGGLFLTSTRNADGARFIHLLNLDGFAKTFHLSEGNVPLLDARELTLGAREAVMLPLDVPAGPATVLSATTEITSHGENSISFRRLQDEDVVVLESDRRLSVGDGYRIERDAGRTTITSTQPRSQAAPFGEFTVRFDPA